jgi:hypothetical protein
MNLYAKQAKYVAEAIVALDKLDADNRETDGLQLGNIPVEIEGETVGYIVDMVGGAWSYREAIPEDKP